MMVVLVFDEYVLYCNHYWGEAGTYEQKGTRLRR